MQYRKMGNTGCEVSALGFGCMRFPTLDGKPNSEAIDQDKVTEMLRYAIDHGVNYLDTAYVYHGGQSEIAVGKALQDGYRDKTYLATKVPVRRLESGEQLDSILDEELEKLQTDHIDFYLMHALAKDLFEEKVKPFDLVSHVEKAKRDGKVRFMGFSFHDDLSVFKEILDYYDGWDFCQIQHNYINTDYQAGNEGLAYAASKGLGVVIMEPLLGGRLAVAPPQVAPVIPEGKSAIEFAFDYLWNKPEVSLTLSGMGSLEMVKENLAYAERSSVGMLTKEDLPLYAKAKEIFDTMAIVPCTKCGYCMPCPFGVDIPGVYDAYNKTASLGIWKARPVYAALSGKADQCVGCGACFAQCPQHINSPEIMPQVAEKFAE